MNSDCRLRLRYCTVVVSMPHPSDNYLKNLITFSTLQQLLLGLGWEWSKYAAVVKSRACNVHTIKSAEYINKMYQLVYWLDYSASVVLIVIFHVLCSIVIFQKWQYNKYLEFASISKMNYDHIVLGLRGKGI